MKDIIYNKKFYQDVVDQNYPSARIIAPAVRNLVHPKSVIDFGCGVGVWLKAFDECCNLERMLGLDGDWVKGNLLLVPEENIKCVDFTEPFEISDEEMRYDLAICLEVAEHIGEEEGEKLINNIVKASDIVLFSAAIPHQGGTGHINERWQSNWVKKFESRNYICLDVLRPMFWDNEQTGIYRQNMFLFINQDKIGEYPQLQPFVNTDKMLDVVHPALWNLDEKNTELFDLLSSWINKELDGYHIVDYLKENQISEVAVYGIGNIGMILLKMLSKSNIRIKYAIDRQKKEMGSIPFYQMTQNGVLPPVQTVIVTAVQSFADINSELKQKLDSNILNLRDVIYDMGRPGHSTI